MKRPRVTTVVACCFALAAGLFLVWHLVNSIPLSVTYLGAITNESGVRVGEFVLTNACESEMRVLCCLESKVDGVWPDPTNWWTFARSQRSVLLPATSALVVMRECPTNGLPWRLNVVCHVPRSKEPEWSVLLSDLLDRVCFNKQSRMSSAAGRFYCVYSSEVKELTVSR